MTLLVLAALGIINPLPHASAGPSSEGREDRRRGRARDCRDPLDSNNAPPHARRCNL